MGVSTNQMHAIKFVPGQNLDCYVLAASSLNPTGLMGAVYVSSTGCRIVEFLRVCCTVVTTITSAYVCPSDAIGSPCDG